MRHFTLPKGLGSLALLAFGGASFAAACSSGSDSHAAAIPSGGSSATDGGSGGTHHVSGGAGGGSGARAGSASADAGQSGDDASDAGAAGSQQGTVVDPGPGSCSEKPGWAGAVPLAGISTTDDERLLSVTADELDIVFLRGGALYLAHRGAASDDFGTATAVTLPPGYSADAGAALSGDGKTLVLVSTDGQTFGSLARDSRTVAFGSTADSTAFVGLNARAVQTLEHFTAPVLAPDGKSFVFTAFTPAMNAGSGGEGDADPGVSVVYEALWSTNLWQMPNNISKDLFDGTRDKRPLPSALSSDSRTLFYFDEGTSKEVARFRDRPDAPLYDSIDLGGLQGAVPNSKCDRVYYSSAGNVLTESD